jgi:hypothetical protein
MPFFERFLARVGDLDDSFYADERQRDVWNEASAVGFQLFLWVTIGAAAVLPWVAGRTGAWISVALLAAAVGISLLTLGFARSRGVDLRTTSSVSRPRMLLALGLYLVAAVGVFARLLLGPESPSVSAGWGALVVGMPRGLALAIWGVARDRRSAALRDANDADVD